MPYAGWIEEDGTIHEGEDMPDIYDRLDAALRKNFGIYIAGDEEKAG